MAPRELLLMAMVWLTGCAASGGAVTSALINTAIAGTASGVRRAQGECYTPCNPGYTCNKSTGMCEAIPCGGRCGFDQKCEITAVGEQCVNVKVVPSP